MRSRRAFYIALSCDQTLNNQHRNLPKLLLIRIYELYSLEKQQTFFKP